MLGAPAGVSVIDCFKEIMFRYWRPVICANLLVLTITAAEGKADAHFEKLLIEARNTSMISNDVAAVRWEALAKYADKISNFRAEAFALTHCADRLAASGDEAAACKTYKLAIQLRRKCNDINSLGMARNLLRYATVSQGLDQFEQVESVLSEALSIVEKQNGAPCMKFQIMSSLADEYCRVRKFAEAESVCKKILELSKRIDNANSRGERLAAYGTLSLIYAEKNEYENGERTREQINELSKKQPTSEELRAVADETSQVDAEIDKLEIKGWAK